MCNTVASAIILYCFYGNPLTVHMRVLQSHSWPLAAASAVPSRDFPPHIYNFFNWDLNLSTSKHSEVRRRGSITCKHSSLGCRGKLKVSLDSIASSRPAWATW